jgi:biopolymer transport protein ExbB
MIDVELFSQLNQQDMGYILRHFMAKGGPVLWWLGAVVFVCWLLVIERLLYLFSRFPAQRDAWVGAWQARADQRSWYARAIRQGVLFQAQQELGRYLGFIKALVAICPMLGLLGTVTGMISVFDVMASQGTSDPRLMASGISMATLPTMAGMVAALAGMFAHARLVKACQRREIALEQALRSQ